MLNRLLIDPFQSYQLPEIIEEFLETGIATSLAFNRRGTLLAAGTHAGPVHLYDWDTRGVACTLEGHTGLVAGLAWSRNGRRLATVGHDSQLIVWDVLKKTPVFQCELPCPGVAVSLSPREPHRVAVTLTHGAPLLFSLADGSQKQVPVLTEADFGIQSAKANAIVMAVACFSKDADMLIIGNASLPSVICVFETETLKVLDVVKVPNAARVTGLILNRKGNYVLANCQDRTLRLYELNPIRLKPSAKHAPSDTQPSNAPPGRSWEDVVTQLKEHSDFKKAPAGSLIGASLLTPKRDFIDKVERCKWASAAFSPESDYIAASALSKTQHHVYIWEVQDGKMDRLLEGKEGTGTVVWHPLRHCVCSQTWPSGKVYIWARAYAENWSAFAPDFKELDENAHYCEQEDEFDWQTPGATGHQDVRVRLEQQGDAAAGVLGMQGSRGHTDTIDILSVSPDWVWSSDDEDQPGEQLNYLPVEISMHAEDSEDGEGEEGSDADSEDGAGDGNEGTANGDDADTEGQQDTQTVQDQEMADA